MLLVLGQADIIASDLEPVDYTAFLNTYFHASALAVVMAPGLMCSVWRCARRAHPCKHYLTNTLMVILYVWHKNLPGLKGELIRIWCTGERKRFGSVWLINSECSDSECCAASHLYLRNHELSVTHCVVLHESGQTAATSLVRRDEQLPCGN